MNEIKSVSVKTENITDEPSLNTELIIKEEIAEDTADGINGATHTIWIVEKIVNNISNKPIKYETSHEMPYDISDDSLDRMTCTDEKSFKCDICDKTFTRHSGLTKHRRTHTGEKPYKCNTCEKNFADKSNLTKHKRIHTGEKLFKCNVCDKTFAQLNTLVIHERTHTGEKPFTCSVCNKKYVSKSNLTTHKRMHTVQSHHN